MLTTGVFIRFTVNLIAEGCDDTCWKGCCCISGCCGGFRVLTTRRGGLNAGVLGFMNLSVTSELCSCYSYQCCVLLSYFFLLVVPSVAIFN